MNRTIEVFASFSLFLMGANAHADSLLLPDQLHCAGQVCSVGMPGCASEEYGNAMSVSGLSLRKPVLTYDARPDVSPAEGSVEDQVLFVDLATVSLKFKSTHVAFAFKRADLEALEKGSVQTISGSYARDQGKSPHQALLQVECTSVSPTPTVPMPPMSLDTLKPMCVACHGDSGGSPISTVPNIGGQKLQYLVDAMNDYSTGARNDLVMSAMNGIAQSLGEQNIATIAAYYSGLKRPSPSAAPTPAPAAVQSCCACHSPGGSLASESYAGILLTRQTEAYLATQLNEYANGVRSDFLMRYLVKQYTAEELNQDAAYFASSNDESVCSGVGP